MTDTQENQLLSIEEAADILQVSTRTVRRWVKDGKLERVTVQGKFGPEIRLKHEQVLSLSQGGGQGSVNGGQEAVAKPVDNVQGAVIRLEDFLDRLEEIQKEKESAVARMGYLQGKLEAQESEVKMLKSVSDEKRSESEYLKAQLTEAESQKRLLDEQLKKQRRVLPLYYILYFIFGAILTLFLITLFLNR
jgi:MerR family copper efflux transcriptional regulator